MKKVYFKHCKTKQEAKSLFRQLVLKNHPDVGGNEQTMSDIILEYKAVYDLLPNEKDYDPTKQNHTQYDSDADFTMSAAMVAIVNQINHIPNIDIELIGVWLWIGGDTKPVKDILYKVGFKWHGKKKLWYWAEAENKKRYSRSNIDINVIRSVYGSSQVDKVERERIAQ